MQLTFIGSSMTKRNKSCESEVMLTMQRKELNFLIEAVVESVTKKLKMVVLWWVFGRNMVL